MVDQTRLVRGPFREWLRSRGLNLLSLHRVSGVSYWRLRHHSAGLRTLPPSDLADIAKALNVEVDEIPTFTSAWTGSTGANAPS